MIQLKDPVIVDKVFSEEEYSELSNYLKNKPKNPQDYSSGFGRYCFNDSLIDSYAEKLIPIARKQFNSENLIPSYSLFAHYEGEQDVAMIFFHFVEPDHWWVQKGPGYLDVIRKTITEEQWNQRQQ